MPCHRALVTLSAILLLLATVAWGCSSSDDELDSGAAAAQQGSGSAFTFVTPSFTEVRPRIRIPTKNTCHGENESPLFNWTNAPAGTVSFALLGENVDSNAGIWAHWILFNIPADVTELPAAISTSTEVLPDGTTQGTNDYKNLGYQGPCPPARINSYAVEDSRLRPDTFVPDRYRFRLYALDAMPDLAPGAGKIEFDTAIAGHILAQADASGKFTPPLVLSEKGSGFLESGATATAGETSATNGEKIYNSLGQLITPTPAAGGGQ